MHARHVTVCEQGKSTTHTGRAVHAMHRGAGVALARRRKSTAGGVIGVSSDVKSITSLVEEEEAGAEAGRSIGEGEVRSHS